MAACPLTVRFSSQGVRDALDHVGTRCSQRPRQISAPAARKTSRTRYRSPRQRRSAQAPASWAIDCSTSARSPACRRLQAVVGPLGVAAPVDGAAVPDRCMPVRARLGQPPKPPVQQAWDLDAVQHPLQPRQGDELVLVAATRPAPVHPQQVTPDGGHRQALGGVGVPLGVARAPSGWPGTVGAARGWPARPPRQPRRSGPSPQQFAQVVQGGDAGAVGLAEPERAKRAEQQVQAVADLGLARSRPPGRRAGTTARPTPPPPPRPGGPPATVAGCRLVQAGVAGAGGRGDRPARPGPWRAARSAGSMTARGPDLQAGVSNLPMVWSPSMSGHTEHHGHPQ